MNFMKRTDAVSPVIGVILMVAITVILAAVIAAFVFGMASSVSKSKNVAATATAQGNNIMIVWEGGPDNAMVAGYNISVTAANGTVMGPVSITGNVVGNATSLINYHAVGQNHVTITGTFTDGTQQVVLDSYI